MASNYFGYDYFCGANVHISIAGQPVYEVAGIRYQEESSTMPIYGYSSRIFDAVATGQKIIKGHFIINFIHPNYIANILNNGFKSALLNQQRAELDRRVTLANSESSKALDSNDKKEREVKDQIASLKKEKQDAETFKKNVTQDYGSLDNVNPGIVLSGNTAFSNYISTTYGPAFDPKDIAGNVDNPYMDFLSDFDRQIKEAEQTLKIVQGDNATIKNQAEKNVKDLDKGLNGVSQAQQQVEALLNDLSKYDGAYSYTKKAEKIANLETSLTNYFKPIEQSTSTFLKVNDVGLLGPFNLDIRFAREYTIKIIDCFITSRGSVIQIDESSIVEEYSFFAREIAYT